MTPHEARSAKGSSFRIILSQFKRALGCAASRIAAETKLRRTFLIRPTKQGADIAARSATSNHYNRFSGNSPHWFHSSENEDVFNDFYTYKTHYQNFYPRQFRFLHSFIPRRIIQIAGEKERERGNQNRNYDIDNDTTNHDTTRQATVNTTLQLQPSTALPPYPATN